MMLFVVTLAVVLSFIVQTEVKELPDKTLVSQDCNYFMKETDMWVKSYEDMEDQWLTCQRDLANCQEEMNHETICTDQQCKLPTQE